MLQKTNNRKNTDMIMQTFELVVLFIAALATGGLMVNWAGLARAMAQLSPSTYVELHQTTNRTFDPYMPVVVAGAIVGGVVSVSIFFESHVTKNRG